MSYVLTWVSLFVSVPCNFLVPCWIFLEAEKRQVTHGDERSFKRPEYGSISKQDPEWGLAENKVRSRAFPEWVTSRMSSCTVAKVTMVIMFVLNVAALGIAVVSSFFS